MVALRRVGAVLAVVLVVVASGVGVAATTFERPRVESVDATWGRVDAGETQLRTEVVVVNPNPAGVPGVVDVHYTARLNDVVVAEGTKRGVGLAPGRNTVTLDATMDNEAIAAWWVTHVNRGEQSSLEIDARVSVPGGIGRTIDVRETSVETAMLEPMRASGPRTVTLAGEEFVVLRNQSAEWGRATAAETPVRFSTVVENRHEHALTLDGVGYSIRMNDVTVGEGRSTDGVAIAPGEAETVDVRAVIDTPRMADWWATHVRNNETTRMTVEMYGLVERDGELRRVPVPLFAEQLRFETDLLGGGGTTVEAVEGGGGAPSYEQPELVGAERRWGEVADERTEVVTAVTIANPNEGRMNEFVRLSVGQRVSINEVVVANGTDDLGSLSSGNETYETTVAMDNSKVPQWWARHVNRGERSTAVVEPRVRADLGFTAFEVPTPATETEMETDLLAGMESDATTPVRVGGRRVGAVHSTSAEWERADADTSPFAVRVTVENDAPTPMTVESLRYVMNLNDVTVADGTDAASYTVAPGETRTVEFTVVVDSQRMDEWWASHVRNGERTVVSVDAQVTVSVGGYSETVPLDQLTREQTVETDFLGTGAG